MGNDWRPIDDEARDGTEVLYWSRGRGMWVGNHPEGYARGRWKRKSDGSWCGGAIDLNDEPTHYHPLPSPPEEE